MLQTLANERRDLMIRVAELDRLIAMELAAVRQSVHQDQDLLDAKTAARRLGVAKVTLYERARLGLIPSVRIGRAVRFKPSDLTTYITRRNT